MHVRGLQQLLNAPYSGVMSISIHACVKIATLYAGIVSKEEVILIHACVRIVTAILHKFFP